MLVRKLIAILVVFFVPLGASQAALEIKIGQGNVRGMPVAVVPFKITGAQQPTHLLNEVIDFDLAASGKFEPISNQKFLSFPSRNEDVRFKDWRFIDAEGLVIGEIRSVAPDQFEVTFRVYDVAREKQVGGYRYMANNAQLRSVAHEISDLVYKSFTGRPGAYNSKIAFIKKTNLTDTTSRYSLMVADWDGYGEQEVYSSSKPLLSPSWSPDSKKIAFVAYNNQGPVVRVLELATGQHSTIAAFKGVNSAPAWSPRGDQLAYATSKNGSPDVFIYNVATGQHRRVTTHYGIDTEPAWSANGSQLLFTSNRTGKPQIYQISANGGESERISYEGKENANASYDFEGKQLVMVTDGGKIAVQNKQTGQFKWLTNAKFDESPSFSPNGDMVLYASEQNYRAALIVSSSDGRVRTKLDFIGGDVREPAWSALKN